MNESLIIRNFVGIKYLKIDLKKLNILIGPQATGKSVVAKLFFYFKNFIWELVATVENEQGKRELDKRLIEKFENYFPPDSWGQGAFSIRYQIKDVFIEMAREEGNSKLSLTYSNSFRKELGYCRRLIKKALKERQKQNTLFAEDFVSKAYSQFMEKIKQQLGDVSIYKQLFIPAGRSFFANLQSNVFTLLSINNAIDPFLINFGAVYENIKKSGLSLPKRTDNKVIITQIESLVESILCGKYINEKGQDYIQMSDGRKISLANSSSGQQEILPLALILRKIAYVSSGKRTIYIEEPEAHLFPTAQHYIIELIATVFNASSDPLQFLITTHSPYMLTAINNLLQAGKLYQLYRNSDNTDKLYQLEKIVPYERILLSDDLVVYSLEKGSSENIISQDTGLIKATVIDDVSDQLAIQFDKLLDID
jgi:AAA15 family ATPase/GTPase